MWSVLLWSGNADQVKVSARSRTAADMQIDRVVMTASQLHLFSQQILGPTFIPECDISHTRYAKTDAMFVVYSYG